MQQTYKMRDKNCTRQSKVMSNLSYPIIYVKRMGMNMNPFTLDFHMTTRKIMYFFYKY